MRAKRALELHESWDHGVVLEQRIRAIEQQQRAMADVTASVIMVAIRLHEKRAHTKAGGEDE